MLQLLLKLWPWRWMTGLIVGIVVAIVGSVNISKWWGMGMLIGGVMLLILSFVKLIPRAPEE